MNIQSKAALLAYGSRLESELNRYEESGCKTLSVEDWQMANQALQEIAGKLKAIRAEERQSEERERKANHMRTLNRATLGNAAVEAAFLAIGQRGQWEKLKAICKS